MTAGEYLKRELTQIACGTYQGESDLTALVKEWKTPWGIELCKRLKFPTADFFAQYKDELLKHNVFQNQNGLQFYNRDIILVNSSAIVEYNQPQQTYYVLLYSGSSVVIKARNCAVVKVCCITEDNMVDIIKSDNSDVVVK